MGLSESSYNVVSFVSCLHSLQKARRLSVMIKVVVFSCYRVVSIKIKRSSKSSRGKAARAVGRMRVRVTMDKLW